LCGDVTTGRGIDQVLAQPCDPTLHEDYVASAKDYVSLAEQANGPIPRNAEPSYVWGAALDELNRMRPDARIINLETAITRSDDYARKGINYRMSRLNRPSRQDIEWMQRTLQRECLRFGTGIVLDPGGRLVLSHSLSNQPVTHLTSRASSSP
jgi:hypothetical protein